MKISETITKETWTKGAFARDKNGNAVGILDQRAVAWCLIGWIEKVYFNSWPSKVRREVAAQIKVTTVFRTTADFNDHPETTFEDVLDLCKRANV